MLKAHGPIALAQGNLMGVAFLLMLVVVVPVIVLTLAFAWRYRAGGKGAHAPDWDSSRGIEALVWGVPAVLIVVLGVMVWTSTHRLDPLRPLPGRATEVQAIAQDWKWVFLYPDLGIATVNELAFPAGQPLHLTITSDVAMTSFMIPGLGGQIYAMAGMTTEMNLAADAPGRFLGRNMQFNGTDFPDQTFAVLAQTDADFEAWTAKARAAPEALTPQRYATLRGKQATHPAARFRSFDLGLFDRVVMAYGPHPGGMN